MQNIGALRLHEEAEGGILADRDVAVEAEDLAPAETQFDAAHIVGGDPQLRELVLLEARVVRMAHHELRLGDLVLAPRPELLQAHLAHAGKRQFLIAGGRRRARSEEHTSELQSLMRISYAVFCLTKKHKKYP